MEEKILGLALSLYELKVISAALKHIGVEQTRNVVMENSPRAITTLEILRKRIETIIIINE